MDKLTISKWSDNEETYQNKRSDLTKSIDLQEYMDHPYVFCKRQSICSMLSRVELFKKILKTQGAIIECGVHKGNSLMLFYHLSTILEPYAFNRKIIGFDTFCGFRSLSKHDDARLKEFDFANAGYETLKQMADLSNLNRPVSHIPKLELVKGDAKETIPAYVEKHPELIIAMLYLDFDIYEPTKMAIKHLLPLVPKGGIVAFDELNESKWKGETIALKETLPLNKIRLRKHEYDPSPSYFVVGE